MTPSSLETSYRLNWPLPLWLTALLIACVFAAVVIVYARESSFLPRAPRFTLAALRLISLALIALMLAQPTRERRRVAPPRLTVLVDRSASMGETDEVAERSRQAAVIDLLGGGDQPLVERLAENYDVQVFAFDENSEPMTLPADRLLPAADESIGTRVGSAIETALRDSDGPRPAAIVVATDGIVTAGPSLADAAELARTLGTPLFTIAAGSGQPRPDVSLDDLLVERVAFPGDRLTAEATLRATAFAGQRAEVRLIEVSDGAANVLDRATVELPGDERAATVQLALRPTEPGSLRLRAEVELLAGDVNPDNNQIARSIEVRRERIRTLLAAASPSYEFRALKSLLERDPAIDLSATLQEADPDFARVDEAAVARFPQNEAELLDYDVLIIGDMDPDLLLRSVWDDVQRFVSEHGGGLALLAGPRFMPWAYLHNGPVRQLAPLELSDARRLPAAPADVGFSIVPTRLGREQASLQLGRDETESDEVWKNLPPVYWMLETPRAKPGATVLATIADRSNAIGQPLPVIARHYVGAGEVLMHATDETWRWRRQSDDRYFARYWGQAVRRLARGRTDRGGVQLSTDRKEYRPGEPVLVRARGLDPAAQVEVQLTGAAQSARMIPLQPRLGFERTLETTLGDLSPDAYELRLSTAQGETTASFAIAAPPGELTQLRTNVEALAAAAETTGGKAYSVATANRLAEDLPPPKPAAVEQLPDEPLWNSHWLLAALCATLSAEWLLRRVWGLL